MTIQKFQTSMAAVESWWWSRTTISNTIPRRRASEGKHFWRAGSLTLLLTLWRLNPTCRARSLDSALLSSAVSPASCLLPPSFPLLQSVCARTWQHWPAGWLTVFWRDAASSAAFAVALACVHFFFFS